MLDALITHWGYLGVGIGTFIEGETVLIAAGALAGRGLLDLPLLLSCAVAGSVAWSQLWFHTGRRTGRFAFEHRPQWGARAARLERFMAQHGRLFVIVFRFVAGMGTVCPATLGASGYSARRYLLFDALGAALWSAVFTAIGWGLSAGLTRVLGRSTHIAEALIAAVTLGVFLWLVAKLVPRSHHNRTRAVE